MISAPLKPYMAREGALMNGHTQDLLWTTPFSGQSWNGRSQLGAPIYLHPTHHPRPVIEASYTGNFVAGLLETAAGPAVETTTRVLRLIVGGAFDRYPNLN